MSNVPEALANEVLGGFESAIEVVRCDFVGLNFVADPVKENNRQSFLVQLFLIENIGRFTR